MTYLLLKKNQKSLSTAFGLIKGETSSTAPTAATLVSDQDYSERPNRHIINTLPPPFTTLTSPSAFQSTIKNHKYIK
ncbi:hypothetical protein EYC84_004170 [Monilinia fructicola]|uniref:Uncharacterized protein n=1 Tax=Monilinia fructicola TaxID=38448 RepID=A0A5M9K7V7_MONFR|nr:hypothetical protein EYC84_004170 [Monilinia fructicola]